MGMLTGPRLSKFRGVARASRIIAFVFLYLIGLSLLPPGASAMRAASESFFPHRTAAATGLEDPAR